MFKIKFQHASSVLVKNMAEARRTVRRELGLTRLSASVKCSDGTYFWRCAADMHRDSTGAYSAAVIESPEQQECHC